ncbi:MAG: nickel-dependent lactate racemase [Chloroflexi bacterium]|nr:nickel-dependent lactate racemase [Chloroflexota bacterium]
MGETYAVPYGKGVLEFDLPSGMRGTLLKSRSLPPVYDLDAAIREALENPLNSPRLRDLAKRGDRVCLVITDATRDCPDVHLVPALLTELYQAGVRDSDITVVFGLGMHRPTTPEERRQKLGEDLSCCLRLIDPDQSDPEQWVDLGHTRSGVPIVLNSHVLQADLVIATGIVEPHLYAGYSGGRKTVGIGTAAERTIEHLHSVHMLEHPGTRLGVIEGNPFHEAVTKIAQAASLRFIINVVVNEAKEVVAVKAGKPEDVFACLVEVAKDLYTVPILKSFDIVVAGVGYPKDSNLYQASRAPSYLIFAPQPVVRKGGVIIVPAPCPEGVGDGIGERRFYELMKGTPDLSAIIANAHRYGYKAGEQRAFVMAKVLQHCAVIFAGTTCPDVVRHLHMIPAADMQEAFEVAQRLVGSAAEVLIVPHALMTLPVISP